MPAESRISTQRALEIHPSPFCPVTDHRSLESRHDRSRLEPARSEVADGEAGAIQRYALAAPQIRERGADAQLPPGGRVARPVNHPNLLDQAGEQIRPRAVRRPSWCLRRISR